MLPNHLNNNNNHHHHHQRLQGLNLMACCDTEFNFYEFMNPWTFSRTPWTADQTEARPLPTQDNTPQKKMLAHINASSRIRNQDPRGVSALD
jgi:hypothetical protein